jgi:hypothetical protein
MIKPPPSPSRPAVNPAAAPAQMMRIRLSKR